MINDSATETMMETKFGETMMDDKKGGDMMLTEVDLSVPNAMARSKLEDALDADQKRVHDLEMQLNKDIDERLAENPEKMPFAVYFIVPNEFAERYAFYGLTPLLKNFLIFMLGYNRIDADSLYHTFKSLSYFTPLAGAALSDSFLNKFNTIMILSSVYALGLILLSVFSIPGVLGPYGAIPAVGPLLALLMIALGTGGIKPCVSAHGGDQFLNIQKYGLQKFYNYFYVAINTGALITSFVSPAVQQRQCYGHANDCYSSAFWILAGVMIFATGIFFAGKRFYRVVPPAGKFMPWEMAKVGAVYAYNFITKGKDECRKATVNVYGEGLVVEMLDITKVFFVLLPAPIFWMAFDQNGSTWQDMGDQMNDSNFLNSEYVNNAVNPIFILILAPLFANFLYPWMDKKFGPRAFGLLQRMVVGMIFAGLSFILAAVLQRWIDATCVPFQIDEKNTICRSQQVHIGWQVLMYLLITIGEVLFSISGLNFTYIEVGKRMKSSCAAIWLLYVGIGNLLTVALLEATLGSKTDPWLTSNFFWLVSGLCFISAFIQYILSRFYTPKEFRPTADI